MNPADENHIAALRRDDRSALTSVFTTHHAKLCSISYRITNDTEAAKDVVQEVFIKLWRNRKQLTITTSLEAYLKRAVINTSLNYIESKKKIVSFNPQDFQNDKADHQHSTNELSEQIDRAIDQLPVRTRAVFTLVRFEKMSYKEVSESLSISTKAVEKEMMKALRLLREALRDYLPILIVPVLSIV